MSSRPSNLHPNVFSIGSTRLYVVHPVSLWKGTSSSPVPSSCVAACACSFSASHGQTSPRGTPPRVVRSWGQIGARPVMRRCQRAARGTRRVAPSAMDSDSRKSVVVVVVAALSRVRRRETKRPPGRDGSQREKGPYLSCCPASPQLQKNLGCS